MYCPKCKSSQNKKNGFRRGKQSYRCKNCGCQYVENPKPKAYSQEVKQLCRKMYLNGMGFRAIERVKGVHNTTVMLGKIKRISKQFKMLDLNVYFVLYCSNG